MGNEEDEYVKRITNTKNKNYEQMTCFARYKYAADEPVLRVHIWDLFDKANQESKNFTIMFEIIEAQLRELYKEQGFESDDEEISIHASEKNNFDKVSEDSTNVQLMDDIYHLMKRNIFDEDDAEQDDSLAENASLRQSSDSGEFRHADINQQIEIIYQKKDEELLQSP